MSMTAQVCPPPTAEQIFHGNDIRTVMTNSGSLFQQYDGLFQVPFTGPQTPNALISGGLWLGGFDDVGNLKVAGQTFRSSTRADYGPGPLTSIGTTNPETCSDWDKIWIVNRNDISAHLADLHDNGQIDDTIPSIFGWPGNGSKSFEFFNGFPMIDTLGFGAPFDDQNGNNIYDPHLGEYPLPRDATPIPMVIGWTVYNDNSGIHTESQGDPLRCDIQLTMYAFSCEEDILNQSLFLSYKIFNRGISPIDSLYFAQWLFPGLGCIEDDAIGSFPEENTFFVYNMDNADGAASVRCGTGPGYGENPPVLAVTYLNHEMSSLMYYNSGSSSNNPIATTDPQSGAPLEFYRYMTGSWKDGTPLSAGGSGYDPSATESTPFAFTGDPNDTSSWAMTNADLEYAQRRIVGSVKLGRLNPGQRAIVDLAYTFHRDTSRSNLGNVSLMYENIPKLKEMYNWPYGLACDALSPKCTDDCVYAGDTDHDGKVTLKDYINTAVGQQTSGPERPGPISFLPIHGDEWDNTTEDGVNFKHLDCNGNGKVEYDDLAIVDLHYGNQADWYEPEDQEYGNGIQIVPERSQMIVGENFFDVKVNFNAPEIDSLYGLVFAFEYDPQYFDAVIPSFYQPPIDGGLVKRYNEDNGRHEFIVVATDLKNRPVEPQLMAEFSFFGSYDFIFTPPVDTTYFRITDVKAVLADGTILDLHGQEVPLYIVLELTTTDDPAENGFRIYPNPTQGRISIENTDLAPGTPFSVFSGTGQMEYSGELNSEITNVDLPPGLFYIVVHGDVVRTEKVIVID